MVKYTKVPTTGGIPNKSKQPAPSYDIKDESD